MMRSSGGTCEQSCAVLQAVLFYLALKGRRIGDAGAQGIIWEIMAEISCATAKAHDKRKKQR